MSLYSLCRGAGLLPMCHKCLRNPDQPGNAFRKRERGVSWIRPQTSGAQCRDFVQSTHKPRVQQ